MTTITLPRATVEQALEALESVYGDSCDALHALRAALAQQAEPTWVCPDSPEHRYAKPGYCKDCGKTLVQQAEPVAHQAEPLTVERLRDALVASRIIQPAAVEDPDGYDDGVTLFRIEALHRRIT